MNIIKYLCLNVTVVLALSACTPVVAKRGNMLEDYQIKTIKPGTNTRTDVLQTLGSPTTVSTFDNKTWYYLGQETEKRGIFDSEVKDETIVQVVFDDEGIVKSINKIENNREDIPYARTKTPTHGNDLTFMQQLLGNLGRFNQTEKVKPY